MNRTLQIVVGLAALIVIAVCLTLSARFHLPPGHRFGEAHAVQTFGDTNYVVTLAETTVSRTDQGYALIAHVKIENPNDHELRLLRDWFVLVDPQRNYFQPTVAVDQAVAIQLAPRAVAADEQLGFFLGTNALSGGIALKIGKDYWVLLKSARPYAEPLAVGELRSFQSNEW